MIKTQLGVGVLSIPMVLITLGIVPGIICILGLSSFTGWANYQVGRFKRLHPDVCASSRCACWNVCFG